MSDDELRTLAQSLRGDQYARLAEYRGGCSCHVSPPCGACSDPLTQEEAEALDFIPEPAAIDYIGEVRRLCK